MCNKSLTPGKKIGLVLVTGLVFLFIQPFVMASEGDDEICSDSGKAVRKKEMHIQEAENAGKSDALYYNASYLLEASENEMEIENWMLNPDNFFWQENEMSLEKWMYDVHSTFWEDILIDDSEEYAIESWMMKPSLWMNDTQLFLGKND